MVKNQVIHIYCLFMFSENMQLTDEEIDIKDEPLFPPSENDKVGWIILDIVELFIGSDGSRALYLRSVVAVVLLEEHYVQLKNCSMEFSLFILIMIICTCVKNSRLPECLAFENIQGVVKSLNFVQMTLKFYFFYDSISQKIPNGISHFFCSIVLFTTSHLQNIMEGLRQRSPPQFSRNRLGWRRRRGSILVMDRL